MTREKFEIEINTLNKFFTIYCENHHRNQEKNTQNVSYKESDFMLEMNLCKECKKNILYSFERLQECPHEEKPRCRKCPNPCYEKTQWKNVAKVMKYSAIKLSLKKIKSPINWLFT